MDFFETMSFANIDWYEIWLASVDTFWMLGGSLLFTVVLGLPLGILLFLTGPRQMFEQKAVYTLLSLVVNILRSLPFIILLIVMIPLTVLITGTSLGVAGAIPPLVVGATPFFARLVETALREVDKGIIEATQAMGASTRQIIWNALLPEARPGIIAAITVTAITLVSYTAMAGVVGAGGLGDLAIRFGYQRFQTDVMVVTVVMLLILVQILQTVGDKLVVHFSRK
ncbi:MULTISPECIES: methionine ABC transporter permease [Pseudomonas aeruginosa group]|uniref:methionine ABC transporter permease n=1 Tax=Pseudomonas aeruginosa group TaxID=136841 RepID=UPI0005B8B4F2|nr:MULTISPECIES: methionine ABC transporter permease [Pseudomonas aeruginosa group]KSR37494.1 D-methionine ABC transporter [Pseudomonas aeruginosa]MCR3763643.1 ABC transporter permease [Pseudomonas aeruginosa]MDK2348810.1 methionine ABC transporter permease [Pseudomonas paraeruginosa]MEA8481716.1 ABC transporter permease [Pseudomonas aeruginosa]OFC12124.1 metal ABC transporter permease [Pseudomonas aeruginosa]